MKGRLSCGHVCECWGPDPDDCADVCCLCAEYLIGRCETCIARLFYKTGKLDLEAICGP